jgi:hypothetical protein
VSAWQIAGLEEPHLPLWQARLNAYRKYGLDGWLKQSLKLDHPFEIEDRVLSRTDDRIETETVCHTSAGDISQKFLHQKHDAASEVEYLIKDPEREAPALRELVSVDPLECADLDAANRVVAAAEGDAVVSLQVGTTLDWWLSVRGPQAGIPDVFDHMEKPWFRELWELHHHQMLRRVEACCRTDADLIYICCGYTSLSVVSPKWWEDYIIPEIVEIVKLAHQGGKPVCTMCNGNSSAVLEMIADTGSDAISPLERPPLGDVEMADAAKRVGDRMCLVGNVNPIGTMLQGTPDRLEGEIKGIIDDAAKDTGLIVSTSDQVPLDVTDEMLHRFREAVARYGTN